MKLIRALTDDQKQQIIALQNRRGLEVTNFELLLAEFDQGDKVEKS